MLSGIQGYMPAAEWGRKLSKRQRQRLGFRKGRTPAASTLFEVLQVLSWEALEAELRHWIAAADFGEAPDGRGGREAGVAGDPAGLAIDGKTARGSWKRGAEIAHLLAVVTHDLGLTVAQAPVARKRGELTAVRPLLKKLVLEGLVVTVDAQFTQADLAQTITDRGGDYVMRVKENQPTLRARIEELLSPAGYERGRRSSVSTHEVGHGRLEERQLVVQALRPGELAWPGAAQIFVVISQRVTERGQYSPPMLIYGVTSLRPEEADAARLLRLFRGHWTVENRAFWVRDQVLGEDASPVATGNLVAVLASLRGAVLNLIRGSGYERAARAIREFNADRTAALRALGCP
jgi:predicted transposase YbfD/YdcC